MDKLASLDSSRYLQPICAKSFVNILHLVLQISKIPSQKKFAFHLNKALDLPLSLLYNYYNTSFILKQESVGQSTMYMSTVTFDLVAVTVAVRHKAHPGKPRPAMFKAQRFFYF